MSQNRIKTNANFKKLLPFSGDEIAVPMFTGGGLFHHMSIKMPNGRRVMISFPEDVVREYPEYFTYEN
jgi:hypothetical protein